MPGSRVALALSVLLGLPEGSRDAQVRRASVALEAGSPLEGPETPGSESLEFEAFGALSATRRRSGPGGSALARESGLPLPGSIPDRPRSTCRPRSLDSMPAPGGGRALRIRIESQIC